MAVVVVFVTVPQSTAALRFRFPLIKPDVRFSRIRLSDKASRLRPRKVAPKAFEVHKPRSTVQVLPGIAFISPAPHAMLLTQPLTEPLFGVSLNTPIGGGDRTQAEVVAPANQHSVQCGDQTLLRLPGGCPNG